MVTTIDEALLLPSLRWVIAYIGGWKQREVIDYLVRFGYLAYSPSEVHIAYRGRGPHMKRERKIVTKPLFGGYLFVGEIERPLSRSTHPRIFDILGDSSGPFYVRPQALSAIRAAELCSTWDHSRALADRFPAGKMVTIKRGHFAQFQAIVEKVETSGKIRVKFHLFGRETETTVDGELLLPAA